MKKGSCLTIIAILLCCITSDVFAQQRYLISGSVIDTDGNALAGATVVIKGTTSGSITNLDGRYSFQYTGQGEVTLAASFVGYSPQEKILQLGSDSEIEADFSLAFDALGLDELIVTGVANANSKLESSVSITTLTPASFAQTAPRTTAEIFRTIPGIRSEASGGDGNTNISVRGVPISAGGAKYLQLQEDGLPVFLFGDIAFATSDIFMRVDQTIGRIEAIRGGPAATQATNSPAGIINFISKTGVVQGGSISTTLGLDYNTTRTDFEYGGPAGDGLNFHIGGFFRSGEGPRRTGYTAQRGGQLKANLTKNFESGYARLYFKHLNDRTPAYMPMPIQVTGTNADPTYENAGGLDATRDAPHSVFLSSNFGIGSNGQRRRINVSDGMHPKSQSFGAEFVFDLGDGWSVENRGRFANNSGRFVAPFPSAFGTTEDMMTTIGDALERDLTGATLTYAHDGTPYTNELSQVIHLFDTELKDFSNIVNDFKLSRSFEKVTLSAGYYRALQTINMAWLWNSYLMEVEGDNAGLVDITLADGTTISESGQFAYGVPVWGNCCQVEYNSNHDLSAPYFAVNLRPTDNLNIDGSVRFDKGRVRGVGSGGVEGELDVNNDGVISPIEENVAVVDQAQKNPVNFEYDYVSYSFGANLKLSDKQAVFSRLSRGASAKADRAIFPSSPYLFLGNPKDVIDQFELGFKQRFNTGGLFITGFYANTTEEGGFEATTQQVIENDYRALGVELEGSFRFGDFDIRGAFTYTDAEITSGDNEGNTPRRQPNLLYSLISSYRFAGNSTIGLSMIGQTDAHAQDSNELVIPGYSMVNGFVDIGLTQGLSLSLSANNLFDTFGITESEEGSITEGQVNYLRVRSVTGRSVTASVRYSF
ncbi:MAG: TonB-dependent receptor [Rhodothermaceae bacterium]|nr:TonB-dependent receptor [Rhodothermaceae bacterium]